MARYRVRQHWLALKLTCFLLFQSSKPAILSWHLPGSVLAGGKAWRLRGRRAARQAQGLIFAPGDEGPEWWDARNSASPVVLPPGDGQKHWQMWYYGREGTTWAKGVEAFLPTGRIGTAKSADGISWRRLQGPLPQGACLDPSADENAFDCVHVGVGDVVRWPNGSLWMYYFGGGLDDSMAGRPGLQMQIGCAESVDGGKTWVRLNRGEPILRQGEAGSFDELFVSWPRVLPPWIAAQAPGIPDGKWYMSYHTAKFGQDGITWSAGAAFSDDGLRWQKAAGPVLTGGPEASWDCKGVGVRSVAVKEDGRLVMLYEAVDASGDHAIGLAESADGIQWEKSAVPGAACPGGPLLTKSADANAWDERVVGTPYAVPPQEGEEDWRLYYVGEAKEKPGLAIGLALSAGSDLTRFSKLAST